MERIEFNVGGITHVYPNCISLTKKQYLITYGNAQVSGIKTKKMWNLTKAQCDRNFKGLKEAISKLKAKQGK